MKIAAASCDVLLSTEVDDHPFHDALRRRGAEVHLPSWSDPTVNWAVFDLVLLRTTWDYQEHVDAFLAWAETVGRATRLVHGVDVVRWNARKTYLRDLHQRGVPLAPTEWVTPDDVSTLPARLAARGWARAFLKPVVGATARETLRFVTDEAGLQAAEDHVRRVGEPFLCQPYLDGVEREGELSVVFLDGRPSHGVRKVPVPGDYRVQDDFGAHDEPYPLTEELMTLAHAALAAAADVLGRAEPFFYGRVDALRHDGALVLNELEVIEPSLFFRHGGQAADRFAEAVLRQAGG